MIGIVNMQCHRYIILRYIYNLELRGEATRYARPRATQSPAGQHFYSLIWRCARLISYTNFNKIVRPKSLLLVGPTRLGKTVWARSLGRHMYMCGSFNLDDWDDAAQYLVLDDIPWKYLPSKKCFLGGQLEFVLTDKYRKKKTVRFGKPTIYSMNNDNYLEVRNSPEWEWIMGNTVIVTLENKLY